MSSIFQSIREAMEDTHSATCDIYGATGSNTMQDTFNEAMNNQMRAIAEQEEIFEDIRQRNAQTPVTDKVNDIIQKEKIRSTEALRSFNRDHPKL